MAAAAAAAAFIRDHAITNNNNIIKRRYVRRLVRGNVRSLRCRKIDNACEKKETPAIFRK